jgi:uroporphyrinogen-III decarboxylase
MPRTMVRKLLLDLAARGARFPIGTDLVIKSKSDHEAMVHDGERLGGVIAETARRYATPLAIPLMDLTLEKAALLGTLGVREAEAATYHFSECPSAETVARASEGLAGSLDLRTRAAADAVRYVRKHTDLVAMGMCIGPFSLTTKLLADPITPVFIAGSGVTAAEDPDVAAVEACLAMAEKVIERSIRAQLEAGARAVMIAEPAANIAYISPKQMDADGAIWDRYVMGPNRRIQKQIADAGAELVFHCCGELTESMVGKFGELHPAMLSLGSSRKLWEDARRVASDIVLYGNLPTKRFYSDQNISVAEVEKLTRAMVQLLRATNHPFIVGSECDVLSVPGCEAIIERKIQAMIRA